MSVISLPQGYLNKTLVNRFSAKEKAIPLIEKLDLPLLTSALILLGLGLVMVASSSISIAERQLSEPLYYFWHQLFYSVIGLVAGFIIFKINWPSTYCYKFSFINPGFNSRNRQRS